MAKPKSQAHKEAIALSVKKRWEERKKEDLILANYRQKNPALFAIAKNRDVYRQAFLNLTAATVRQILNSVETGDLVDWMEFVEVMTEEDPHLRGLMKKRLGAISSKELKVAPADPDDPVAVEAASLVSDALANIKDFDRCLRHLLDGIFTGVGCLESMWSRENLAKFGPVWAPTSFVQVPGKRLRIGEYEGEWVYYLYNWGEFGLNDQNPMFTAKDKFIIHSPGEEDLPHRRGLLRALAFTYFFKKLGTSYWLGGAEKFSFPAIYALVPNSTPENVRTALVAHLDSLTTDGAAVLNSDVEIKTVSGQATGGDLIWRSLLQYLDTLMTKLILGGTLAVEAAAGPGGNRALGEVHERSAQEIVDGDARALAETLKWALVKPILEKNLHLFGGQMPPIPTISFDVRTREPVAIGQIHLQAQAVTINEMRKEAGLPAVPWGTERAVFGTVVPTTPQPGQENPENAVDPTQEEGDLSTKDISQKDIEDLVAGNLTLKIQKKDSQWCAVSEDGSRSFGCYDSKEKAIKRLQQVEYFKHTKE